MELGYMLAQDKRLLLLKERSLPRLPSDLVGHLYKEFDGGNIAPTIAKASLDGCATLGLQSPHPRNWSCLWEKLGTALRPLNASVPPFATLSAEKRYQARLAFYSTVEFLTAIKAYRLSRPGRTQSRRLLVVYSSALFHRSV
jgi:hypothetical protein